MGHISRIIILFQVTFLLPSHDNIYEGGEGMGGGGEKRRERSKVEGGRKLLGP